jgi:uncharacterized membrane protein HdeD (DUF308 family)
VSELPVVEHGGSRPSRWLHERRLRVAAILAVLEGVLVALDVIPSWLAILVAIGVLAVYFGWAREHRSATVRESSWILAVWQALVLLVPVLVIVVGTLALVAVALIAVVALLALFADRRTG